MRHRPHSLVVDRGRRMFLAGMGGSLALPLLESLRSPRVAHAWSPAPGGPRRLIIMFHAHGSIMEELLPRDGFTMGRILRPVEEANLTSKILVVGGVDSKVESGHSGATSLFTCTPLARNQYDITSGTSPSVEHTIARHMQDGGLPRRLDVCVDYEHSLNPDSNGISHQATALFWSGDHEHIGSQARPQRVFQQLFPGGTSGPASDTDETVDLVTLRRRSVLDGVLEQFDQLQGRVSRSDRDRLERHATRIREIERSLSALASDVPELSASCGETPTVSFDGLTYQRLAELQVDLLAHAMACNHADVGTFKIGDLEEDAFGFLAHPELAATFAAGEENYHGAWHLAADNNVASARSLFTSINAWYGSLFARLLTRLDEIDEGDRTALDSSMIVWASDFGHGGGHASGNLSLVLAGNVGGAALGRYVNFSNNGAAEPWGHPRNPGNHNLAVTMRQAFGIPDDSFGNYTDTEEPVEPGPLAL